MSSFMDRRRSLLSRCRSNSNDPGAINGHLSLKDLVCCLSLLAAGTPKDKLEFMFRLYDTDGNGILDSLEIESIINHMMTVARYSGWDVSELKPILQEMMQEVDYNADGCVTLEEWMKAGSSNIPLMVLLGVDSMVPDEGCHSWELKHFNRPAYCNHCLNLLIGLGKQGLRCIYCRYTVHERCVQKCRDPCITTYSKSKIVQPMAHHWVAGNCSAKCNKCKKHIKSYNKLTGKRCRWCKISVHNKCLELVGAECDMGEYKEHILSPAQISPAVLVNSNSIDNNLSSHSLQLVPLPDVVPLIVFINPKSGGKQGKSILKKFQYILNPRQVFNVASDKGFMNGLQFFRELPNYKILCCGGDGTVGWLLESMDKMNYGDSRPAVAVLPLGTGNDLARSLKWGGGYEGEDLRKVLDQVSQSVVVTLDRWRIDVKETSADDKIINATQSDTNKNISYNNNSNKNIANNNNNCSSTDDNLSSDSVDLPIATKIITSFLSDDSCQVTSRMEPDHPQMHIIGLEPFLLNSSSTSTEPSSSLTATPTMTEVAKKRKPSVGSSKIPCNIINNYFSIGVDASIAHRFHVMREKHPEKFNSRMKNKLIYLEYGTSETWRATCKNLHESVHIFCDGVPLDLMHGRSMEGVAMLNIPSIYGGSNLWGDPYITRIKKRKKIQSTSTSSDIDREFSSGSVSSVDLCSTTQDMGDKLVELVGLIDTIHMVKVKGGMHSGKRLAQCSNILIQTTKEFPMQIDGEPWIQPPCTISIVHENQVPMLMATAADRKSSFFGLFSSAK
ncbi:hypothetical protein HELRODRAFT_106357 [Helobdella robusta]|uniref:Diacylglycerol kinase n=1 Tax=Helobdella robusta TaxID=6412 RepID=T1EE24_HELRO|nr:hypothetical protein HELRODRAFT_106357 [Helobdella robusta]ESO01899.1 hypothetical protein HELRODRAFT_106357 [Helobdella robusta]